MTTDPLSPERLAEMRRDLVHYAPDGLAVVHPKTLLALFAEMRDAHVMLRYLFCVLWLLAMWRS